MRLAQKLLTMIAAIAFFSSFLFMAVNLVPYTDETGIKYVFQLGSIENIAIFIMIISIFGYLLLAAFPNREKWSKKPRITALMWFVAVIISLPFAITEDLFGQNELEPILVFFRDNQINDMMRIGVDGFSDKIKMWIILVFALISSSFFLLWQKKYFNLILIVLSCVCFIISPIAQYIGSRVFPNQVQRDFDVSQHYAKMEVLKKSAVPKNLVVIYLESVERTYSLMPEFEAYYEPLRVLSENAKEFTDVIGPTGTNYTIAGIVATHCGIPLLPKGLDSVFLGQSSDTQINEFLSGTHCLSDQLMQDGYTLSYSNGASVDKFSKRNFLMQHGYTRIFDKDTFTKEEKKGRVNVWGVNDALLFEHATNEFDTLANQNKPFMQSLLTISTHGPDAFLDNNCPAIPDLVSQIPRAIQCTGQLVSDFVGHIKNSSVGEDTVIVIMSDHFAFLNTLDTYLKDLHSERRNLLMIIDGGESLEINRKIAPFDVFPTVLDVMGYELKNGRANLGVSAFSKLDTLAEKYGQKNLNKLFKSNQELATFLWDQKS